MYRCSDSYAAAQGASVRGEESSSSVGPKCFKCNKTVYFAEEVIACRRKWHKLCLKCGEYILCILLMQKKKLCRYISLLAFLLATVHNSFSTHKTICFLDI